MKKYRAQILMLLAVLTLSACEADVVPPDQEITGDARIGRDIFVGTFLLVTDFDPQGSYLRSPTAIKLGGGISVNDLISCLRCNLYKTAHLRSLLTPGEKVKIEAMYKSQADNLEKPAQDYFVVSTKRGEKFVLSDSAFVQASEPQEENMAKFRPLEELLQSFQDNTEMREFLLTVSPGRVALNHPEMVPPYTKIMIAEYFNPLITNLDPAGFNGLRLYPEQFSLSIRANKMALADIILHSEGLMYDIMALPAQRP